MKAKTFYDIRESDIHAHNVTTEMKRTGLTGMPLFDRFNCSTLQPGQSS